MEPDSHLNDQPTKPAAGARLGGAAAIFFGGLALSVLLRWDGLTGASDTAFGTTLLLTFAVMAFGLPYWARRGRCRSCGAGIKLSRFSKRGSCRCGQRLELHDGRFRFTDKAA